MAQSNPRYTIIRGANTYLLVAALEPVLADGVWECSGGPFYDAERREWCQAVIRLRRADQPGEVALREPKRRAL